MKNRFQMRTFEQTERREAWQKKLQDRFGSWEATYLHVLFLTLLAGRKVWGWTSTKGRVFFVGPEKIRGLKINAESIVCWTDSVVLRMFVAPLGHTSVWNAGTHCWVGSAGSSARFERLLHKFTCVEHDRVQIVEQYQGQRTVAPSSLFRSWKEGASRCGCLTVFFDPEWFMMDTIPVNIFGFALSRYCPHWWKDFDSETPSLLNYCFYIRQQKRRSRKSNVEFAALSQVLSIRMRNECDSSGDEDP